MGVTRDDVARAAGVSSAVVSYVINNGPRPVAAETRERVLNAIQKLGYRANFSARSLRGQRSRMLGIVVPDASNTFYSEVIKGVEDGAFEHGYELIVGNTNQEPQRQKSYVESLISRQVDGLIFVTLTVEQEDLVLLDQYRTPAVYIDPEGYIDAALLDQLLCVTADFEAGGYQAGQHLIQRGHREIVVLTGKSPVPNQPTWRWHRTEGFMRAMKDAGLAALLIFAGEHLEDGYRVAYEVLQRNQRPSAIFAGNDLLAIGALRAAHDLGIAVPKQFAVCGFDDIAIAEYVNPRLTTVRVQKYHMGQQAASMLLHALENETAPMQGQFHFATELIIRETT